MSRLNKIIRRLRLRVGGSLVLSLGLAVAAGGRAGAEGAAETTAPAKTDSTPVAKSGKAGAPGSVKENIKQLGNEISDPSTLQRIKAHEQEAEKKVVRKREQQRKDHGKARPNDAVDLAKSLDKPDSVPPAAPGKTDGKPAAKNPVEATPPPAATKPAATKPAATPPAKP